MLAPSQQTDSILSSGTALSADQLNLLLRTLLLLLQLYYDLNSQDLPEFFEDRLAEFMPLLLKYLDFAPAGAQAAADDDEDEEAGDLEAAKAEICDIAQLYSLRYLDAFGEGGYLGPFVEKTWGLLTKLGPAVKYDTVRTRLVSVESSRTAPAADLAAACSSSPRRLPSWARSSRCRRSAPCSTTSRRSRPSARRSSCPT